ncbi:protein kinase domain-containing protein [Nocardiopsis lambiniae]|uniref:Protein kinase n=1 Tax=Nocardiopsis lambiniae TaxID=3075539 RepID=A0ABU2M5V4_9ACTN|nr:protein kinase [Nocardiopsis sp. DSM 44743]MDT0328043.1 protein kinase [Nocardiopsis sp. DSM 44743]
MSAWAPGYETPVLLTQGRRARIVRATRSTSGADVVLKVMSPRWARAELERLRDLSGVPGVVPLLDAGSTSDGNMFVALPFYSDGSFAELLAGKGPAPIHEAAAVARSVASALEAMHRRGWVHGDVCPGNVLRAGRTPVLTGFGAVHRTGEVPTPPDPASESFLHAPPEALRGEPPTPASDVYRLASTVWTLLVGRPPFADGPFDPRAHAERVLTQEVGPVPRQDVSRKLRGVLTRALAKDPQERYPSAAAFANAFEQARTAQSASTSAGASGAHAPTPSGGRPSAARAPEGRNGPTAPEGASAQPGTASSGPYPAYAPSGGQPPATAWGPGAPTPKDPGTPSPSGAHAPRTTDAPGNTPAQPLGTAPSGPYPAYGPSGARPSAGSGEAADHRAATGPRTPPATGTPGITPVPSGARPSAAAWVPEGHPAPHTPTAPGAPVPPAAAPSGPHPAHTPSGARPPTTARGPAPHTPTGPSAPTGPGTPVRPAAAPSGPHPAYTPSGARPPATDWGPGGAPAGPRPPQDLRKAGDTGTPGPGSTAGAYPVPLGARGTGLEGSRSPALDAGGTAEIMMAKLRGEEISPLRAWSRLEGWTGDTESAFLPIDEVTREEADDRDFTHVPAPPARWRRHLHIVVSVCGILLLTTVSGVFAAASPQAPVEAAAEEPSPEPQAPEPAADEVVSPSAPPEVAAPSGVALQDNLGNVLLTWTDNSGGTASFFVLGGLSGHDPVTVARTGPGVVSAQVITEDTVLEYCFTVIAVEGSSAPAAEVCTTRGQARAEAEREAEEEAEREREEEEAEEEEAEPSPAPSPGD